MYGYVKIYVAIPFKFRHRFSFSFFIIIDIADVNFFMQIFIALLLNDRSNNCIWFEKKKRGLKIVKS